MKIAEISEVFKKNKLISCKTLSEERKIVFEFANNHTLSIQIEGNPGIHYEWDESVVVKLDGHLLAKT